MSIPSELQPPSSPTDLVNDLGSPEVYPWLSSAKLTASWWKQNYSAFFDWVAMTLDLKTADDWNSVMISEILQFGRAPKSAPQLLHQYLRARYPGASFGAILENVNGMDSEINNNRPRFDRASTLLGLKDLADWYSIPLKRLEAISEKDSSVDPALPQLKFMRKEFKSRLELLQALQKAYPEHPFYEWKLEPAPKYWWGHAENRRRFMDAMYVQLNLQSMEDWYKVDKETIMQEGGSFA